MVSGKSNAYLFPTSLNHTYLMAKCLPVLILIGGGTSTKIILPLNKSQFMFKLRIYAGFLTLMAFVFKKFDICSKPNYHI